MTKLDLGQATASDMTNYVDDVSIDAKSVDGISDQKETTWENTNWTQYWGDFNTISDLKSAVLMKGVWDVGKGYTTEDDRTQVILDRITGWGKDTFDDILFNMDVIRYIGGDSYAEVIRRDNKATGDLLNLKPLDSGSMKHVIGSDGLIIRYEQTSKVKGKASKKFKPWQIFHLCHNRLADQIHGISVIESMRDIILAEQESFKDLKKLMHHQVKPFILWKLKTDDPAEIAELVRKIDTTRNLGEDMFIPDDDDAISYEVVQLNLSQMVFNWRDDIRNKFYRAMGLPLIIFGSGGSTESGGKIEYFAHEQVFEHSQRYLEKQLWAQLAIKIDLIPPQSMQQNLATDESKDKSAGGLPQGLEQQPADTTAGVGK